MSVITDSRDKVLCAELEALERTHAGIAAAVTGTGADRVGRLLGACAVNEVIAQVAAASFRCPQARSVIDIGGQDSKYIQLEPAGEGDGLRLKDFSVSSMCASGTGSFLDQQATRLGLDIETEFGEAALRSRAPARIAGRCSVFAKSDMIHLQQKGAPVEDIVAGLCHALARSFKANVVGVKALELPVALVGGVAANAGVVKALRSVLHLEEDGLFVPEDFALSGAFGAALFLLGGQGEAVPYKGLAAFREGLRQRVPMKTLVPLQPVERVSSGMPGDPRMPGRRSPAGFMPPLRPSASSLPDGAGTRGLPGRPEARIPEGGFSRPPHPASRRLPRSRRTADGDSIRSSLCLPLERRTRVFLGIDIGSISTNIVLMDENREVVAKYYLMTASRPIEAVRTGFRDILERYGELADVQAVGVTGSGRHLIGDLAGADVVVNGDHGPCHGFGVHLPGGGHHFRDRRAGFQVRAAGEWPRQGFHHEQGLRRRDGQPP